MRRLAVFLAAAVAIPLALADPATAISARPGIVTTTVASGFTYPTSVEFLPDGRMLVADKQGEVWLVINGVTQATPVIDLRARINSYWDRGLVGMAVDPNFASNGFIYLYYALQNSTGDAGTKTSRLSRFTMVGNTADPATEFIVMGHQDPTTASCSNLPVNSDCIPADFYGHQGGGLQFASDGTLWFSVGDSSSWDVVDDRALRAQDLTVLSGKLLHITSQGKGIASNPFWTGNADDIKSKIYAYGFRNPFRLTVHPTTGVPYVADVGWNNWEELDKITAGGNYGWPCYEGTGQQSGYAPKSVCQTLYNQGASAVKTPFLTYPHSQGSSAITGGVFLKGTSFPALYQNAYLFGDYARDYIHYLDLNSSGDFGAGGGEQGLATAANGPVDFTIGPDGAVYYVAILSGEVRRIAYQASGGPTYVSDLPFTSATNGTGPYERDYSNGANEAGDGGAITLAGVQYAKGLGVAAPSQIELTVPAGCTSFSAVVGVDDEVGSSGSVHFIVGNGANPLSSTTLLTGSSATQAMNVPLTGVTTLRLTVDDGGDGNSFDHADWADAKLICGVDNTPPTVVQMTPADGTTGVNTTVAPVARFSEPLNATTVSSSTVALTSQPGGSVVPGTLTYNDVARSITFTPTSPLTANASFAFRVLGGSSGIADLAGNKLQSTTIATFTTGSGATATQYVSDMTWGTATNGWGPPERDRSNGEQGANDGGSIRVAGTTYAKGVGVHANAAIPIDLTGLNCTRFQSVIGIDDEVGNQGSVRFQVWNGTTTMLTQSAAITGSTATTNIDLDITGINSLRLVVTDNGDNNYFDHADWADAKITCAGANANAPTVVIDMPAAGAQYAVGDKVSFSGSATASNGSAIPSSQLNWDVEIRHCPQGNCHLHPLTQVTGTGGSIIFPDHGDDSHIDIKLTATDGAGNSASLIRTAEPKLVGLTLQTSPAGLPLVYTDSTVATPVTEQVVINGTRTVSAPAAAGYTFQSWSDGGAAQHDVTMGGTARTLTATYTPTSGGGSSTRYVSDMPWGTVTNGWGPPERDHSNGEQGAADGGPIVVAGTTYAKGVGAHANSTIPLDLTGLACTRFQSVVGVDDEVGNNGSVRFQVWNGTTTMLTQSAALTGASAAANIDIDVTNITSLRLVVTDNGDGNGMDHADWADAKLTCASDTTPPTVTSMNPTDGATGVSATIVPTAQMSEALNATTVSSSTVTFVTQPGGAAVAGTVGYDAASKAITFKPTSALAGSTSYRFQILGGASGVADLAGNRLAANATSTFTTAASNGIRYVSDMPWGTVANGWGPPERDHSNGEQGANDGGPIVVAGTTYAKGVGAHANSTIPLDLTGLACTRFQSVIGVDDEVGNSGSVRFQVWNGTTTMLTQSAALTGASATANIDIDITGVTNLRLLVTDNGDGNGLDHADWADAKVTCSSSGGGTAPTVTSVTPTSGANGAASTTAATATFSEAMTASTITSTTATITRLDSPSATPATVSYNTSTNTVTITPSAPLTRAATFVARIAGGTSGVKDSTGTAMTTDFTWRFTTATEVSGSGLFQAPSAIPIGLEPHSVAIGDVDNDGVTDLLVVSAGDSTLAVLKGAGGGSFGAPTYLPTGAKPKSVVLTDLNGDGRLDAITANQDASTISVFKNSASGFQAKVDTSVCNGAHEVAIGDLNNDGKTDVAVACTNVSNISVLMGNGDGTFQAPTSVAVGSAPHSIVIADFNGDGKADIAVANHNSNTVSILLGNGAGTFTASSVQVGSQPHSVRAGDVNGDGKLDLVTANDGDTTVSLLIGVGNGTFQPMSNLPAGNNPKGVTLADINGDGKLDILAADAANDYETSQLNPGGDQFSVLLGDGAGGFQAPTQYTTGPTPFAVAVGDINGDGKPDVVTANWDGGTITLWLNSGATGPPPGGVTHYISDMSWGTATNGWGPPERDRSNGESGAGDGVPIKVAGTGYAKGVGVNANATIPVSLTGLACTRFQAVLGLDDEVGNQGSVIFQLWNGSTTMLAQTPTLTGASAATSFDVNITGVTDLRLVVTDAGDNNFFDHADWADAKVTCAS